MISAIDDELIDLIYAAVLGESTWQEFLDRLSKTMPGGKSTLFCHDANNGKGTWELNSGFDPEATARYAEHYCKINPWMPGASTRRVGLGVVAEQMLPSDQFGKTEFYNDFYGRSVGRTAVGVTIVREQGRSFLLSTATSRSDPNENMEAAERLTRLSPHLRRAFRHFQAGSRQQAIAEIGNSLFDAIDVGLVMVGEGASIKSISAAGQKMIESGSGVRLTPLGRIRICSPEADAALNQMLDRSFEGQKVLSFAIDRSKLTFIRIRKDRFSAFFEGPTVIVLMEPLNGNRHADIRLFAEAYHLTEAEARALAGIVDGKSVDEIADGAMRSRETIRTQMKSLYAKTGVSSQTELLRMVGRLRAGRSVV